MNQRFYLPACFAAAAHGALLFGFSRQTRPTAAPVRDIIVACFEMRAIEEEPPVVVESESEAAAPKRLPDAPQPVRIPEPPMLDLGDRPTMKPPPIHAVGDKEIRTFLDSDFATSGKTGSAKWGEILSSVKLDRTPRARFQSAPIYPFEAKRGGVSGEVQVEFIVDEQGRVNEPRVVHSTNRIFDEATLRAVAKWQFEPGRRHGEIVRFRMTVPFVFNLSEGS